MKIFYSRLLILFLFILIIIFPTCTFQGATSGLLLWYSILLPTLLPFMILTSIILKTQAYTILNKPFLPIIQYIFHTSRNGSFAVIIGFLCGYPMGAKIINNLYEEEYISLSEAQYLLSFCNNSSPMFIISFFVYKIIEDIQLLPAVFLSVYGSAFLMSIISRKLYLKQKNDDIKDSDIVKSKTIISFKMLDDIIIENIILIMKIGGYIMIFSILISIATHINNTLSSTFSCYNPIYILCSIPLLEITNGLQMYKEMLYGDAYYSFMVFLVSMGGFCSIGQTQCVITAPEIKISHYFTQKILTAILAVSIWNIFFIFFDFY